MFRKRHEDKLWKLQQELLAAEEEEYEAEYDDSEEYSDDDEFDEEDIEDCFDSDYEEEYEQEQFYRSPTTRYGRKSKN